MTDPIRILVKR